MIDYRVQALCEAVSGELVSGDGRAMVTAGVCTDTRALEKGCLFIALVGDRFDAHDYLAQAVASGAAALMVSSLPEGVDFEATAVILVPDTLLGLQRLARWYREQLAIPTIAITGSNGKTSTKDFTAAVLREKFEVNATEGNLNNHIGLPLSILRTEQDDEVCVFEMGMNHPGEIAPLCEIAQPHIGIITNIGTAHIEYMGSRDSIAEEKGALPRSLPEVGTFIMPIGCPYLDYFRKRTAARTITVANGRGVVRAEDLLFTETGSKFKLVIDGLGSAEVEIPVTGRHMVNNALLAAAAGWTLGLTVEEIANGLEAVELTSGRLRRFEQRGIAVYDDTYNANPESVRAAIDSLAEQPGGSSLQRTVVLGMMAELGVQADRLHHEVGQYGAEHGVRVVSVGESAAKIAEGAQAAGGAEAVHFNDYEEAVNWLKRELKAGDQVLFKGSRMAAVEKVMNEVFPTN